MEASDDITASQSVWKLYAIVKFNRRIMRVAITATSENLKSPLVIEANTIDEVIAKLRNGEIDITPIIDTQHSNLCKENAVVKKPTGFVVIFGEEEDYDVEIEIYDNWRE